MKKSLSVLIAQINTTVGAIDANTAKIRAIIETHQAQHDVILFPECCLSGYPAEDLWFRPAFQRQIAASLELLRQTVQDCHVIIGHPWPDARQLYNAASVFHQQTLVSRYYKQKLPNYGVFDEKRYFQAGPPTPCILSINNYRFGICICEDLWHPEPIEQLLDAKADGLLCLNASPFDLQKQAQRESLLKAHANRGLDIVYVNAIGGQDELLFDGQSMVFDKLGQQRVMLPAFKECLQTVTLTDQYISGPLTQPLTQEALLYEALVCATRDYVGKNKFPGVLIGLSGGIDSALTLCIAVDALGPSRVKAVMMPSRYSAGISKEDAELQLKALGVDGIDLSIEPAFISLLKTLSPVFKGLPADTTEENIQARIRGILLMALSNKLGYMVLTTSNKSETAVGYATLYGDMAGGFAVLKDVLKTQVYALAHYRNTLSHVIPDRVLTRAPSAELAKDQTDQDSLPDYAILDAIITEYMVNYQDADAIIQQGFDKGTVERVVKLIQRNEYKRRQAAPGPKISTRAFGRDWRYPITSGFLPISKSGG